MIQKIKNLLKLIKSWIFYKKKIIWLNKFIKKQIQKQEVKLNQMKKCKLH